MTGLIRPQERKKRYSEIADNFGLAIDRYINAKRQNKKDDQADKLFNSQLKNSEQTSKMNEFKLNTENEKQDTLQSIFELNNQPLDPTLPKGFQGPQRSPEYMQRIQGEKENRKARLVQKFQMLNGKIPESPESINLQNESAQLDLQSKRLDNQKKQIDINKTMKELEGIANGQKPITEKTFEIEQKLRKEYISQSSEFEKVRDAFGRIKAVGDSRTAAGDLALIFNYMKLLDPGSVVRESEFRSAEQAKAWLSKSESNGVIVPSFVRTAIQKADPNQKGAFLLPEQRSDFLTQADNIYSESTTKHNQRANIYKTLASNFSHLGVSPNRVVVDLVMDDNKKSNQSNLKSPSSLTNKPEDEELLNSIFGGPQPQGPALNTFFQRYRQ